MIKGINRILLPALVVIVAVSCGDIEYNRSETMPGNKWSLGHVPVFSIPVTDTINSFDISFSIRTGSSYPFRNIYFFVTTTSPDGKVLSDTVQYNITDEKGKRYGTGFGDIRELALPYKLNVYFPSSGTYVLRVQHGMRKEDLEGVYDLALRIDRTAKK